MSNHRVALSQTVTQTRQPQLGWNLIYGTDSTAEVVPVQACIQSKDGKSKGVIGARTVPSKGQPTMGPAIEWDGDKNARSVHYEHQCNEPNT